MNERIRSLDNLSGIEKRALLEQLMQKESGASQSIHPLSYGQRALWYMQRLMPESPAYNISTGWRILSELNMAALKRTFQWLVDRHSSLRTTYTIQDQGPVQVVHPSQKVYFRIHEVSDWNEAEFHAELNRAAYHVFDLEKGPLMRVNLYLRKPGDHILLLSFHHIAMDLWSLTLLFQDIRLLYPAAVAGTQPPPWPSKTEYKDFVHWQEKMLTGPEGKRLWQYWRQQLAGNFQALELPIDFPRPTFQTFEGAMHPFRLDRKLTRQLQKLSQDKQTTLHSILLAGVQALLYRYSGQNDFLIGSLASGRSRTEFEMIVGFVVNPVMLRASFDNNPTFNEVVDRVQKTVTEAIEHQDLPFALLVEKMRPGREMNRNPLADVLFILQTPHRFISERKEQDNVPQFGIFTPGKAGTRVNLSGLLLEPYNPEHRVTQNDLAIEMVEAGGELSGAIHYRTDLFLPETISRLANHYTQLLESAVKDPEQPVSSLAFLSESERYHLLYELNDTQVQNPPLECIHQLFERQVKKTPDNIALLYKEEALTYQQLNAQANQVARFLKSLDVGPETLVCISLKRSPTLVIALLGILKAGGAFVPVEASSPPERMSYILKDTHPKIIVTENHLESAFTNTECPVVCLDSNWETISNFDETNPDYPIHGSNLAYVIYTSGSTGRPKGVMIEHLSVANMVHSFNRSYRTGPGDRVMQQTSLSFDVAVGEIFPILCAAGTLCLPACEDLEDLEKRLQYINKYRITVMGAVPSLLTQFNQRTDQLSSVRLILSGGEALSASDINKLLQVATVTNGYGPTETTVCSAFYIISPPSESTLTKGKRHLSDNREKIITRVPIGKPIANTKMYILDKHLQPVPIGIPGELYVGGAGLARGYLNSPELTIERFIPNPFSEEEGDRIYRTGDLVRRLSTDDIEFLGRIDSQFKIRGYRVESGEIEAALSQHPTVRQVAVVVREDRPGFKRLVAYVASGKTVAPASSELRQFLQKKLPVYMVPSTFVLLEKLQLTPGGKVDLTALPVPDGSRPDLAQEYVPPHNPIQKEVAKIWAEILGIDKVGIYDNFFELGGHSLLATQLIVQVQESFQVDLPLLSVFEAQTVAGFAKVIDAVRRAGPSAVIAETDLNAEVALDPTICPKIKSDEHVSKPAYIFLTGATGFLGTFLLGELLEKTQADIYCLIRTPNSKEGKKKLQRGLESYSIWNERFESRIIPVAGDLSKPLLGLSTEQFEMLASKIDIIYHNGALVNFVYPYSALKAVNVLGTQEVLRLASQIKVKPVHYISTLSVFASDGSSRVDVIREHDSIDHMEGLYGGYAQSKWVAEKLVKIAGSRGLPFCIYRPGMITGHSQTGVGNTDEIFCKIIQGCIQLKSAPEVEILVGMTPVDYVSRAIVYLSMQKESRGNAFHLVNPHPVPWSRIVDLIRSFGYPLQKSSADRWLSELSNLVGHSLENALYPLMTLFNGRKLPQYECKNTLRGLARTSIVCPAIDAALLKTYFAYFIRSGFLDAPQPSGDLEFFYEKTKVVSQ